MRKCNFCDSDSNGKKLILKLKPCMLKVLGLKTDVDYHICENHFDVIESTSFGKKRRWVHDAKIDVTIEDLRIDTNAVTNLRQDHPYSKDNDIEEDYPEAVDLNMGEDYFVDSQTISCKEETVQDDCDLDQNCTESCPESQVIFINFHVLKTPF